LIISAKNPLVDKIEGLKVDDYLTKPFHIPELNGQIAPS
jgi:DNA-binding response OmpR family regulator